MTHADKPPRADRPGRLRDLGIALACVAVVGGMVGLSYAAVPLYELFCRVTGYGGTTQRAAAAPGTAIDRQVTVRFDANVMPGLPWRFRPLTREVTLKAGEVATVVYEAVNTASAETVGTSTFNVTPDETGAYFNKIQCFCFNEQALKPGERVEMPVVFFVDPAIDKDAILKGVHTITLSYSFFPARRVEKPVADASKGAPAPKL